MGTDGPKYFVGKVGPARFEEMSTLSLPASQRRHVLAVFPSVASMHADLSMGEREKGWLGSWLWACPPSLYNPGETAC